MPHGTAFDIETLKILSAKKTKKLGETGVTIFGGNAGKRFRLLGFCLTASEEETCTLSDEATEFFTFVIPKKPTAIVFNFPMQGYLSIADKNKLILNTVTTEREITGTLYGIEDVQ